MDEIFCERMNNIMNEIGHWLWAKTNEEIVKVQIFHNSIRKDLVDIEVVANILISIQREVLNFDWPNDTTYNEWKDKFVSIEKMEEDGEEEYDEEEENVKVKVTFTINDEDKECP